VQPLTGKDSSRKESKGETKKGRGKWLGGNKEKETEFKGEKESPGTRRWAQAKNTTTA